MQYRNFAAFNDTNHLRTPWGIPGRTLGFDFRTLPTLHPISVVMVDKPSSGAALLLVHMVIDRNREGYMPADRHIDVQQRVTSGYITYSNDEVIRISG